jgi:hypothetical protein
VPRLVAQLRGTAWPLAALLIGILCAIAAIFLTYAQLPGRVLVFVLATLALLIGLAGLFIQNLRPDPPEVEDDDAPRPLQIYKETNCGIELPLLHQLAKAEAVLKSRIRDQGWEADWETVEHHHVLAETLLSQGELSQSFGEYCRAMRPLTEVLHRQRAKEESFQPIWDRTH